MLVRRQEIDKISFLKLGKSSNIIDNCINMMYNIIYKIRGDYDQSENCSFN